MYDLLLPNIQKQDHGIEKTKEKMAALEPVIRDHERMAKKQKLCQEQTIECIDQIIKTVQATADQLRKDGMTTSEY